MFNLPWEALVALLGVLAASLPQLTSSSRLRGKISFWTSQVQSQNLDYDRKVAESSRRDATARLLALQAYPAPRLLIPLYGTFTGLYFGYAIVESLTEPERISLRFLIDYDPLALFAFVLGIVLVMGSLLEILRVLRFRRTIERDYLDAKMLVRQHDDSKFPLPPSLNLQGILQLLGALLLSCGLLSLSVFASASAALGSINPWEGNAENPRSLTTLLIFGAFLTYAGIEVLHAGVSLEKIPWLNPRPLSEKVANPDTAGRSFPSVRRPHRFRRSRGGLSIPRSGRMTARNKGTPTTACRRSGSMD